MQLRSTRLTAIAHAVRDLFRGASLRLDFTKTQALDPRITFSRASNATVTGPDGTLQYAPHNLLTFSEQFDASAWAKTGSTITANNAPAPDGTSTADALVEDASTGGHRIDQIVSLLAGTQYTLSFFAKPAPGAEGRFLTVVIGAAASVFTNSPAAVFDLTTGTSTSSSPTSVISTSVQSADNGYFRVSITTAATLAGGSVTVRAGITNVNNNAFPSFTGDGTAKFFIWGAQLNVGSLQPYYPTTVKNLLGFTQEFDNAAWTKSNSFVQTNLLTWSEQFDNAAWGKNAITISANTIAAPDGMLTADKIQETAVTNYFAVNANPSGSYSTTYTHSIYAKAGERTAMQVSFTVSPATVIFNLANGTVASTTGSSLVNASMEAVGNGWYRCKTTLTTVASGSNLLYHIVGTAVGTSTTFAGVTGNGLYIWGAQLVQGSTPGDYQRTEGTARAVMYPAPDGSRTADKLVENTASSTHFISQSAPVPIGAVVYGSFYVKAAERSAVRIRATTTTDSFIADFDLATGTVVGTSVVGGGVVLGSNITSAGDGWYRVAVSGRFSAGTAPQIDLWVRNTAATTFPSYTGDGTSGIYIWGAQLSDSASLDPYVYNPGAAPAAAAYYGPRFDYDPVTLAPRGLLIEEQRTNQIRNNTMQGAVAGTPGTLPTNWLYEGSGLGTLSQQVVGVGVVNGINYIDLRLFGTASVGGVPLAFEGRTVAAATSGQTFTQSVYLAVVGGSTTNLTQLVIRHSGRSSVGAATEILAGSDIKDSVTATLTRYSFTTTFANALTAFDQPNINLGANVGAAIDITLRIGMPQLEQGAFATSVIPTSGTAATRAADVAVMTGANFSNWYRQDEGTLFADGVVVNTTNDPNSRIFVGAADSGVFNESIYLVRVGASAQVTANVIDGGAAQWAGNTIGSVSSGVPAKMALAYKVNDFAGTLGGVTPAADTFGSLPSVVLLSIGSAPWNPGGNVLNGHIRRIGFFPRRLSNAELQALTS